MKQIEWNKLDESRFNDIYEMSIEILEQVGRYDVCRSLHKAVEEMDKDKINIKEKVKNMICTLTDVIVHESR